MPRTLSRRAPRRAVLAASAAIAFGLPASAATPNARYTVRFDATWSAGTHPIDFPASAHWSPLVGGTHDAGVSFWSPGTLASLGIKDMAERGLTAPLAAEVQSAIAAGHAGEVILGGSIGSSPGTASATFDVSQQFSLATVVSMIAPSPDWFVGASALQLFVGGEWIESVRVPLFAYDAGTDSGTFYTAPNQITSPPELVAASAAPPFQNGVPLGLFTFTRVDAPGAVATPATSPVGLAALAGVLAFAAWGAVRRLPLATKE